ncbi:MAG: lipoate--protein ligase family protein [Verrucomicrobiota bacterium]|nr:lipoate--protein ligase family protein [Verrucomicrobiota bacterium]
MLSATQPLAALEVYFDGAERSASMNMAMDEALLESAQAPALRFYGWRRPALSFGYFGTFADVANESAEREIVRRWTGGGIVPHGNDLTYSLILPQNISVRSARAVYTYVHEAILSAFGRTGEVSLAETSAPKMSDACFANPVIADVLVGNRKIAGAAQRRTRAGLLHQGSIQYEALPRDFREAFAQALCPQWVRRNFAPELIARARMLNEEKYATNEWLHRR